MKNEGRRMTKRLESDVKEALDVSYRAERKIDSHGSICDVRYNGIEKGMATIADSVKAVNHSVETLANRMWIASGSVIAACLGIIIILLKGSSQ